MTAPALILSWREEGSVISVIWSVVTRGENIQFVIGACDEITHALWSGNTTDGYHIHLVSLGAFLAVRVAKVLAVNVAKVRVLSRVVLDS